jgi:hypothetical protein
MPAKPGDGGHGSDESTPEARRATRSQRHIEEVLARIIAKRRSSQRNSPLRDLDGEQDRVHWE